MSRIPLLVATVSLLASIASAAPPTDGLRFFESKVRPLLVERCYKCHGEKKQESDLRLDSLAAMQKGGITGPAIVAGKPDASLLLKAVGYQDENLRMPPDKRLADREIADLRQWIEMGTPYPESAAPVERKRPSLEEGRRFWAFQPPVPPPLPAVSNPDWVRTPVDLFIAAKLHDHGLQPATPADKRTLIRRVTFDLTGLPPDPADVESFVADSSPDAYDRVVERLLSSPAYGERWGRHWLDVARYADSNGLDENIAHGNAWRYRDYVIRSFNHDKPYRDFLTEQLAGDLLPSDDAATRHERLIATGFLSLGQKVLAEVDERKMEMDIVDEQIDTIGQAFLALTLGCSRCHDHKFDPITMDDYYGLAGIFKSTKTMDSFTKIARWHENPIPSADDLARKAAHEAKVAAQRDAIKQRVEQANQRLVEKSEPGFKLPANPEPMYPPETQAELKKLRDALAALEKSPPEMPSAMGVTDGAVADVRVHLRGNHLTQSSLVPRQFPRVIAGDQQPAIDSAASGRLPLAQWLADPRHPLTGRVFVNRVWRWHFGEGLVSSTDNFGQLGDRPSHPELLDWLAVRFTADGFSLKSLHRLLVLSATYQMSSQPNERALELDPQNRLHWRASVRRLEAEAIRDAMLAVSGQLDGRMGGSMLHVKNREFFFDHTSKDLTKYDSTRRSVYLPVVRNNLYEVFQLFDYTDAGVPTGHRDSTTVAPQALFLLNGDFVLRIAEAWASELLTRQPDESARLRELYTRALGRPITNAEESRSRRFLELATQSLESAESDSGNRTVRAWQALCQAVLASNEFIHVR